MAQTVTIVVYPSGADADALTVNDAMRQVLDAFELLSCAETKRSGGAQTIVWKLEQASTNSPFRVIGSAISADPTILVESTALAAKVAFGDGIVGLIKSEGRAAWVDDDAEDTMRRFLRRNMNGVGRTDIFISDDLPPIIINHRLASRATTYLDKLAAERAAQIEDLTRTEYGSVEGRLSDLTTHYGKPAVILRTRLANDDVKCVLTDAAIETIGIRYNWRDVWQHHRVLVTGAIHYNAEGKIFKIDANHIEPISPVSVSLHEIEAYNIPKSLKPHEYIAKMWGE